MGTLTTGEMLSLLMFFGVIGVLLAGYPVAFSLAGTALIFAAFGWGWPGCSMRSTSLPLPRVISG
ncbi:MAG: hypothetical protein FD149_2460 [Rhodospirillaceae bacterium]|nr:MAG: hypothetical protein FD149_2460 [Rhodospirillaceae bacterium]